MATPTERYLQFLQAQQQQAAPFVQTMLGRFQQNREERLRQEQLDVQRARQDQEFLRDMALRVSDQVRSMDPSEIGPYLEAINDMWQMGDRDITDVETARQYLTDVENFTTRLPGRIRTLGRTQGQPGGAARGVEPAAGERQIPIPGITAQQQMPDQQLDPFQLLAMAGQRAGAFGREVEGERQLAGTFEELLGRVLNTDLSPEQRRGAAIALRRIRDQSDFIPASFRPLVTDEAIAESLAIESAVPAAERDAALATAEAKTLEAREYIANAPWRQRALEAGTLLTEEQLVEFRRDMNRNMTSFYRDLAADDRERQQWTMNMFTEFGAIPANISAADKQFLMDTFGVEDEEGLEALASTNAQRFTNLQNLQERRQRIAAETEQANLDLAGVRERTAEANALIAEGTANRVPWQAAMDDLELRKTVVDSGLVGQQFIDEALAAKDAGLSPEDDSVVGRLASLNRSTLLEMRDLASLTADVTESRLEAALVQAEVEPFAAIPTIADAFDSVEEFEAALDPESDSYQPRLARLLGGGRTGGVNLTGFVRNAVGYNQRLELLEGMDAKKAARDLADMQKMPMPMDRLEGDAGEATRQTVMDLLETTGVPADQQGTIADMYMELWRVRALKNIADTTGGGLTPSEQRLRYQSAVDMANDLLQKAQCIPEDGNILTFATAEGGVRGGENASSPQCVLAMQVVADFTATQAIPGLLEGTGLEVLSELIPSAEGARAANIEQPRVENPFDPNDPNMSPETAYQRRYEGGPNPSIAPALGEEPRLQPFSETSNRLNTLTDYVERLELTQEDLLAPVSTVAFPGYEPGTTRLDVMREAIAYGMPPMTALGMFFPADRLTRLEQDLTMEAVESGDQPVPRSRGDQIPRAFLDWLLNSPMGR